ncbi:hypothetical protein RIF29_35341 [Crotalaria pallida]|uniref:Sec7/BIG1-like C-terminal domain-containing protein n=1 Tax=Crotalaria pallida TaxID=3830 RepID=A0AAN9EFS3_CROPI
MSTTLFVQPPSSSHRHWSLFQKVLQSMSFMNNKIFRRHLREFYPLLTKLVCCDQMDVRGALGDLFQAQLKALLP